LVIIDPDGNNFIVVLIGAIDEHDTGIFVKVVDFLSNNSSKELIAKNWWCVHERIPCIENNWVLFFFSIRIGGSSS
jgi:hypothetical protein